MYRPQAVVSLGRRDVVAGHQRRSEFSTRCDCNRFRSASERFKLLVGLENSLLDLPYILS
jgi:hypothetical protein